MCNKLKYVHVQQGVTKLSGRVESHKRATINLELKVEYLMNRKIKRVYGSTGDKSTV